MTAKRWSDLKFNQKSIMELECVNATRDQGTRSHKIGSQDNNLNYIIISLILF